MRKHSKNFIALALALVMCLTALPTAAFAAAQPQANRTVPMDIMYRDIKITLNGTQITPKDAAGNVIEPFVNAGTTYLPVRGISEALGLVVNWDGEANAVYLNTRPGEHTPEPAQPDYVGTNASKTINAAYRNIKITLDGVRVEPKDTTGKTVEPFTSDGTTYLPLRAIASALSLAVDWDGDTSTVILNGQPNSNVPGTYIVENGVLTDIQGITANDPIVIPEGVRSVSPAAKQKIDEIDDQLYWTAQENGAGSNPTGSEKYNEAMDPYYAAFPALIIPSTLETLTNLPHIGTGADPMHRKRQIHYNGTEAQWAALKARTQAANDTGNYYVKDPEPYWSLTFGNVSTTPTTVLDFTDLTPDHPYYDAIQQIVYAANLTSENGKFRPDDAITYGEMAYILAKLTHSDDYVFTQTSSSDMNTLQLQAMKTMKNMYTASPYDGGRNGAPTDVDYTLMSKAVTRGPALCYLYNLLSENQTLGTYEDPNIRKVTVDPVKNPGQAFASELIGKKQNVSASDIPDWNVIAQNDVNALYPNEIKEFEMRELDTIRDAKYLMHPAYGFYFNVGRLESQDATVWNYVARRSADQTLLNGNAILAMYRLGLHFGDASNMTCDPYKTVTRGEFCKLLYDAGVDCNRQNVWNNSLAKQVRENSEFLSQEDVDHMTWPEELKELPESWKFEWPETVPHD